MREPVLSSIELAERWNMATISGVGYRLRGVEPALIRRRRGRSPVHYWRVSDIERLESGRDWVVAT